MVFGPKQKRNVQAAFFIVSKAACTLSEQLQQPAANT